MICPYCKHESENSTFCNRCQTWWWSTDNKDQLELPINDSIGQLPLMPPNAGVKYDNNKPMLALIPPLALEEEAWVWTFGMQKYGAWNWSKGLTYTRIISAALRHILCIMMGEDVDKESGKLHAAHVRCCMGMLIHFQKLNRSELDDRMPVDKPANKV